MLASDDRAEGTSEREGQHFVLAREFHAAKLLSSVWLSFATTASATVCL